MKSNRKTDHIRTWEILFYYMLFTWDIIYYGFIKFLRLIYYIALRIFLLFLFVVPKKPQQSPFHGLKAQQNNKKLLLLDLDGTLISASSIFSPNAEKIKVGGEYIYVKKRPYLQVFIKEASEMFTLGIYTSSVPGYADKVLNIIGLDKIIPKKMRLYRNSCEYLNGNYMKRVTKIEADLRNVLILDNRPEVVFDRKNIIKIESWDNGDDNELIVCLDRLRQLYDCYDVRQRNN